MPTNEEMLNEMKDKIAEAIYRDATHSEGTIGDTIDKLLTLETDSCRLTVVLKEGELPANPNEGTVDVPRTREEELTNIAWMAYTRAQQDMIAAGYVQKVKDA